MFWHQGVSFMRTCFTLYHKIFLSELQLDIAVNAKDSEKNGYVWVDCLINRRLLLQEVSYCIFNLISATRNRV